LAKVTDGAPVHLTEEESRAATDVKFEFPDGGGVVVISLPEDQQTDMPSEDTLTLEVGE
jgi:hypothetical protein